MKARTIVGLIGIAILLGVTVYMLFQVPAEFAIGGIVALVAILLALGVDAPDQL